MRGSRLLLQLLRCLSDNKWKGLGAVFGVTSTSMVIKTTKLTPNPGLVVMLVPALRCFRAMSAAV